MWFANDFQEWLRHSWKSLANSLTRDPKIVIHGYSCIIPYTLPSQVSYEVSIVRIREKLTVLLTASHSTKKEYISIGKHAVSPAIPASLAQWGSHYPFPLTHWGCVMHICVSELTISGSDNGLLPGWHQAIIWTNAGILLIGPLGTNCSEI